MNRDIPDLIQKLPVSVLWRMKLERSYIVTTKQIKKRLCCLDDNASIYYPLVRNNRLYGNEWILRKYSGSSKYLIAMIEHGLYFGNNRQKVGLKHEWELGSILTYGEYRKNLLKKDRPEYYCEMIGPMIHYASIKKKFREVLLQKIDTGARTLLFFPVHGNAFFSPIYDISMTIKKVIEIADKRDCKNIIICVYYGDMDLFEKAVSKEKRNDRIQIVSCGNRYSEDFLCKQKALISLANLTVSNNLGTHLGYCIYMKKPHILLPQDFSYRGNERVIRADFGGVNRSANWKSDFDDETKLFQTYFNEQEEKITEEQYKLCDYYWGFTKVKSPFEIKMIFDKCEKYSREFIKGLR